MNYNLNLILYDHNVPEEGWDGHKIQMILDHHEDKNTECEIKNIQKVGSAITLVAEMYQEHPELVNDEIKDMICSTILIDTFNFDPKLKENRWV